MKIEKKEFSCRHDGFTVRGCEYKAAQNNRVPVILSHAFLSNQKIMKKYAEALAEAGYVAFAYDFCGGAILGKSDGKFSDMSIDTEKADLKSVIAYVEGLDYVDASRLILLGASQGGFVSCLVAAEYGDRIDKLLLLYPALCIPDDARNGKMLMVSFDPADLRETFTSRPLKFSPRYPESAIPIQVDEVIRQIKAPLLIVHGTEDKIVNLRYAKEAAAAASHPASRLIVMDGAGHGFKNQQYREAMGHIFQFLKDTSK